ncbi:MAG: hypothetical protein OJF49_003275 [Ktedonobacterales bacterium]|nr:MAG: hypothetical protein OJF49_003275 [Ktedonobacterales bacterium]
MSRNNQSLSPTPFRAYRMDADMRGRVRYSLHVCAARWQISM